MLTYNQFLKINESIDVGTMTNKGKVEWIDKAYKTSGNHYDFKLGKWVHNPEESGKDADISVRTDKGWFKLSELEEVDDVPEERARVAPPPVGYF